MGRKTCKAIITLLFLGVILSHLLGFKNAWFILNSTHLPVYVVVGVMCTILGISTKKIGSVFFSGITFLIAYI